MPPGRNAKSPEHSGEWHCHACGAFYTIRSHQRVFSFPFLNHFPPTDLRFSCAAIVGGCLCIAQPAKDPRFAGRSRAERECPPEWGTAADLARKTTQGARGGGGV